MKRFSFLVALIAILGADALAPQGPKATAKPAFDLKKAAAGTFAAVTIASNAFMPMADAMDYQYPAAFSSSTVVAEKVVREGLYRDYEVDIVQETDDARSTFKAAKETKSKKGKYTALLAVLIVGSFVIPMAQYFWYVRDDDSSDQFFAEDVPEPPKKKGGFFGRK
mmetsp:Transcript_12408/g.14955  ORF Transcript_12408/g.14955 Transcript_12408/m.14955 type:complete len:166 (-) Transcript_12408:97-594(-)|eukprot:CAMPEP_0195268476 /NCGR_PEP_ID=MMETSP0706-20130129/13202_1 /TAXON_ID=33640 /ORGANISM="Asterionellopsis glacialis, Strain CCMP134" /LENGTH=165 /DNA_ID=CAMNT_0040323413 /DNA_START=42 /DNA_END=539 /DNA_ORIENTATION=-